MSGLIDQIEWRLVIPADPIDVSSTVEEVCGRSHLATVAGTPERLSDHHRIWSRFFGEDCLNPIHQPEGRGVAQPGTRTPLDEPAGSRPVTKSAGIGERAAAAEYGPGRLDVGSRIE